MNCKFCYLKKEYQSTEEEQIETLELIKQNLTEEKEPFNVLLVGGEIFAGLTPKVSEKLCQLFLKIFQNPLINIIYINTNLLYNIEILLLKVLNLARECKVLQKIHFTTSDDVEGRFNSSNRQLFYNNLNQIKKFQIDIIVNTIATRDFCELVLKGKYNIKDYCEKYGVFCNILPYVDFNKIEEFKPSFKQLYQTLQILKKQYPEWFSGYCQIFSERNRDIFLFQKKEKKLIDVSSPKGKCGHSENFRDCCTENKCYGCLLEILNL